MKRVGILGSGAWALAQANLIAHNGFEVIMWSIESDVIEQVNQKGEHPRLPGYSIDPKIRLVTELQEAISDVHFIVECVTTKGIRPTMKAIEKLGGTKAPIVITSKGIEQGTMLLAPQIVLDVLGEGYRSQVAALYGPTLANEVLERHPTSAVIAAFDPSILPPILEAYTTPYFRPYTNSDMIGAALGGALKNPIAVACGIAEGLGFGQNSKSAIITRGLVEMRKLAACYEADPETLIGLSGIGDLCVTCLSPKSRNYRFGTLLGSGVSVEKAKSQIGMVVEGANTAKAALEVARSHGIEMPITEMVSAIVDEGVEPLQALKMLINRPIKDERETPHSHS